MGTRGIPAEYGGFETFAEELSVRLVKKGYDVTVYCRKDKSESTKSLYQGVHLVYLPTVRHKYFETVAHTFFSTLHVVLSDVQIVYYCNAINSIYLFLPRLFGKKVIMNVNGLEWKRAKWNRIGKIAYQVSEYIATLFANVIVSDSKRIANYYKKKFNALTTLISYGSTGQIAENGVDVLSSFGLKKRDYLLYVSRLEPENNALIFIQGFEKIKTDMPLVIVGSAPYGVPYINRLRETLDPRIKFLGAIYGDNYRILKSHAYLYLHGNEVGGTNPALLEAMALGNCVIATGVGFNRYVIGKAGFWFKHRNVNDLQEKLKYLLANPQEVDKYRPLAIERMKKYYNWDDVAKKYDDLFQKIIN